MKKNIIMTLFIAFIFLGMTEGESIIPNLIAIVGLCLTAFPLTKILNKED